MTRREKGEMRQKAKKTQVKKNKERILNNKKYNQQL